MNIYELMDSVIYSDNIESGMKSLLELVSILDKERYTSRLLDEFYWRRQNGSIRLFDYDLVSDERGKNYCIESGCVALSLYIILTIPSHKKPKQTLKELQNYAEKQLEYCKTESNSITDVRIEKVIQYFDDNYQFMKKVFNYKNRKVPFLILDMKKEDYVSEYLTLEDPDNFLYFCFFFFASDETENGRTVEEEVFYNFSLALIRKYFGKDGISDSFVELLKTTCIPKIEEISMDQQIVILAELLSAGLMYESPFQEYYISTLFSNDIKTIYKAVAERMLNAITTPD